MTISEIKTRTQAKQPYFFDRKTMKFFGQTMRDFRIKKEPDGRFRITAPMRMDGKIIGQTVRFFNPITNDLEHQ